MSNSSDNLSYSFLQEVNHIFIVLSGKGGVGKSSVALQLSLCLLLHGFRVGLLDIDLTGPSIPRLLGLEQNYNETIHILKSSSGWVPVCLYNRSIKQILKVISMGFMLPRRNEAIAWRGAKKTSMIQQMISGVDWGALDYLIIDTPPGTGDEHISIVQMLYSINAIKKTEAIMVTTPQTIALADVRKEIRFCCTTGLHIVGIIENMSGYVCPHCTMTINIFSENGGDELAKEHQIPLLGKIPLDSAFIELVENQGTLEQDNSSESISSISPNIYNWNLPEKYQKCNLYSLFKEVVQKITGL
ncbi:hypothetical protein PCANB_003065 [Pneumocystis canis]|nr:hypothetical protein PCANB_003065 [Pneumocystis canis]